jgi:DNA-binding transcriptional regulator PaaX
MASTPETRTDAQLRKVVVDRYCAELLHPTRFVLLMELAQQARQLGVRSTQIRASLARLKKASRT